eukprot:UN24674
MQENLIEDYKRDKTLLQNQLKSLSNELQEEQVEDLEMYYNHNNNHVNNNGYSLTGSEDLKSADVDAHVNNNTNNQDEIDHYKTMIENLKEDNFQLQELRTELKNKLTLAENNNHIIEYLETKIKTLESENEKRKKLPDTIDELQRTIDTLKVQNTEKESEIKRLNKLVSDLTNSLKFATGSGVATEKNKNEKENNVKNKNLEELGLISDFQKILDENRELREKNESLLQQNNNLTNQVTKLSAIYGDPTQILDYFQDAMLSIRNEKDALEEKLIELQDESS